MGMPKDEDWVELSSSNVRAAAWGTENNVEVLWVKFHSGGIYEYQNVSKSVFDELCSAESPGRFVQNNVISQYSSVKVN